MMLKVMIAMSVDDDHDDAEDGYAMMKKVMIANNLYDDG